MPEMTFDEVLRKLHAANLDARWREECGKEKLDPDSPVNTPEQDDRVIQIGIEVLLQER